MHERAEVAYQHCNVKVCRSGVRFHVLKASLLGRLHDVQSVL
jgi:hypothetical protein